MPMSPDVQVAAKVGRYLLSIPDRALGIRGGIDFFKGAREEIQLHPEEYPTRLSKMYNLLFMTVGGTFLELGMPSLSDLVFESDPQDMKQKNTPFKRFINSDSRVVTSIGAISTFGDFAVDLAAAATLGPEAIIFKLVANTASHLLVDALKAGVNNLPRFMDHFRNSPMLASV